MITIPYADNMEPQSSRATTTTLGTRFCDEPRNRATVNVTTVCWKAFNYRRAKAHPGDARRE